MSVDDPYVYPGTSVLINKFDLRDGEALSAAETFNTLTRMNELRENPIQGNFDQAHLQAIHQHLFQDTYPSKGDSEHPFSGELRTIGIRKDEGIIYPHPDDPSLESLQSRLDYAFSELGKDDLLGASNLTADQFSAKLAKHTAEIWECHPFRDGNTRTTFMFAQQLAKEAGHEFQKNPELIANFREAIADYARGSRDVFYEVMSGLVSPAVEKINLLDDKTLTGMIEMSKDLTKTFDQMIEKTLSGRDRGVQLNQSQEIDFEFNNPINQSEYKKAKSEIAHIRVSVEKELYPKSGSDQVLDEIKNVAVNREINKRLPEAVNTVKSFEAYQQLISLVSEWRSTDKELSAAINSADTKNEKRLLRKKSSVLNKILNKKSVAQKFSPLQRSHIKHEKGVADKTLSLHRSRGLGR